MPAVPASLDSLFAEFRHPGAAWRGKPFWSWNGRLEEKELHRQLGVFKEMGMGGAFMHSRTGLRTEYLGDEWFRLINSCADEAERLGLEAWLYDEDRWPSGSAGGIATADPAFRMKSLRLTLVEPGAFQWPAREAFVAAFVGWVNGLALGEYRPLDYGREVAAQAGETVLLFTIETMEEHTFYNNHTYLDTLKKEATEHFLAVTHGKYEAKCGGRLGKSIRGIFTDEPHHGMVMCQNNEARRGADAEWTVPYTEALFPEFEAAWGYDLRARLPEVFLRPGGERIAQVKWHFMELLQRMFLANWAQPCLDWCRAHGMLLTGHALHEDSLVAQAVPGGSVMRYYEFLDYPGIDLLGNSNRRYWVAKQLQSVARQQDKKWLLSEMYGCSGWQLDFAGHREIGAWQALLGVNLRCHHLAWYTMEGEAKRDYPASISFQSAWHREYALVEDFFSRLHVMMQHGEAVCDVAVINPVETVWAQIFPGWAQWLEGKDPALRALEAKYEELFHWLTGARIDFDYADEEHLARLGGIEREGGVPFLRLGRARYRVAVAAGMETMRASTLALLEKFADAGGEVLFVAAPPTHVDAIASTGPAGLAVRTGRVEWERGEVTARIGKLSRQPVTVSGADSILSQVRRDGESLLVAAIETRSIGAVVEVGLAAEGIFEVEEWDCETGERFAHPARHQDGWTRWTAEFAPLGTRVFVLAAGAGKSAERPRFVPAGEPQAVAGPLRYALSEPNLCVLDRCAHRLAAGEWEPEDDILRVDARVRDALELGHRAGDMVQPWAAEKMGLGQSGPSAALELRFSFIIDELPERALELVMERPEIFRIRLNGREIVPPGDPAWLIDPCLKRIPLPCEALAAGPNRLELAMTFSAETDLEAVYLAGDFGVFLRPEGPHLGPLPAMLEAADVAAQGLPFYSGRLTYELPLPGLADSGDHLRVELGAFGGAVACLSFAWGGEGRKIAWPPYEGVLPVPPGAKTVTCEIVLTRVNTFGPLHVVPKEQPSIGPLSFRTEGEAFSVPPQLWPAGLLRPPLLQRGSLPLGGSR